MLELRGDFAAALASLQKAVELSESKNGQFLAELANTYFKTGNSTEAIQSAHKALDLAAQTHNEQLAKEVRAALDRFESNRATDKPE